MKKRRLSLLILLFAMVITAAFALSACNASPSEWNGGVPEMPSGDSGEYKKDGLLPADTASSPQYAVSGKQIIYNYYCNIYTDDLDGKIGALKSMLARYSGSYIESSSNSSNYSYRNAMYRIRVKSESLDAFCAELKALGEIRSENLTSYDVTSTYIDLQAQKTAKEAEHARLLELYEKAETVADLSTVSAALSRVQAELNSIYAHIASYDSLVSLSTVEITFYETAAPAKNPNFWTRLGQTFKNAGSFFVSAFEFIVVALIYILPFGVIVTAVVFAVILIRKKTIKKRKEKYENYQEADKNKS